jgi:NADP-dependent 3-hydroxy acid dehydrogenase YdfG
VPVTLITGGATGIGAATARALLDAGHQVAVTGRHGERLAELAGRLDSGGRLLTIRADAGVDADVQEAVAHTVARFGGLTHVVANAGFSSHDTIADGDPARWREMLLINVLGPALLVHAALPELTKAVGEDGPTPRIVLVGSVAGVKNSPGNMYSVTKWALTGMAENTRMLVTGRGIGVTLIAPGRVTTPFWDDHPSAAPAAGPALGAEDVARSIAWTLGQPSGVDINTVVVRPLGQAN